jgi:hypothetical protein
MIRIRFVGVFSAPESSGTPQHHVIDDTMGGRWDLVKRAREEGEFDEGAKLERRPTPSWTQM